eukprot:1225935-Amorphochlora_amoeboformis.AAC.1
MQHSRTVRPPDILPARNLKRKRFPNLEPKLEQSNGKVIKTSSKSPFNHPSLSYSRSVEKE